MLEVFTHSGFPITRHYEYGTVSLRFPIAFTDRYEACPAQRRSGWQIAPTSAGLSPEGSVMTHVGPVGAAGRQAVPQVGTLLPGPRDLLAYLDSVKKRKMAESIDE